MTWTQLAIGVVLYAASVTFVLALAAASSDPEPIDELPDDEFWNRVDRRGRFR